MYFKFQLSHVAEKVMIEQALPVLSPVYMFNDKVARKRLWPFG
jgi:hypothetical protein